LIPHEKEKKDIIKGIIKIGAKTPHQMVHVLDDKEERKKTILPTNECKGCEHKNMAGEGPSIRCSKDLTSKFKPGLLGKGGQKEK
jgi:hypothetical protein